MEEDTKQFEGFAAELVLGVRAAALKGQLIKTLSTGARAVMGSTDGLEEKAAWAIRTAVGMAATMSGTREDYMQYAAACLTLGKFYEFLAACHVEGTAEIAKIRAEEAGK